MAKKVGRRTKTLIISLIIISVILILSGWSDGVSFENSVAVVKLEGIITSSGGFMDETMTVSEFSKLFGRAEDSSNVKAIVVEINSPGGSPVASAEIASIIMKSEKPVVAWIADVGASGAYWVATSADKIVSHPLSITCSIGAYIQISDFSRLLEDYNVSQTTIKSGEHKDIGSPFRQMTEDEEAIFQNIVDQINEEFVRVVRERREGADLSEVSDGRPCTGKEALELGLVDSVGSRESAISLAEELAGEEDLNIVEIESEGSFLESLIGSYTDRIARTIGLTIINSINSLPSFQS
ncbi:TPA: signal peptide peptidase SppA [archaeon]|jgi:protease-4|uniref:Signal peptide peptidase SppA n=1 Tax=Candidatus Undinarchaeum marinum TaxID=2756141 RepID=A0A832UM85_9ARCH|nr:signal peptide peptidase SppA [Candidatus Undinarchaeum marinum]